MLLDRCRLLLLLIERCRLLLLLLLLIDRCRLLLLLLDRCRLLLLIARCRLLLLLIDRCGLQDPIFGHVVRLAGPYTTVTNTTTISSAAQQSAAHTLSTYVKSASCETMSLYLMVKAAMLQPWSAWPACQWHDDTPATGMLSQCVLRC